MNFRHSDSACVFRRPALVLGHPGHELKIFGSLSELRPELYFLTDGSGTGGASRIASSLRATASLGLPASGAFEPLTDTQIYNALLSGEYDAFLAIAEKLSAALIDRRIDFVAGDAAEGFKPAHDICRAIINAAVAVAEHSQSRRIANYQFSLMEGAKAPDEIHDGSCLHTMLGEDAFRAKLRVAENYPEIAGDIRGALAARGEDYFRLECLRPAEISFASPGHGAKPEYESLGERRVANGDYDSVIRYREHVYPAVEALRLWAHGGTRKIPRRRSPSDALR